MRIDVWDENRREWRDFEVIPVDNRYRIMCGNGLHQFYEDSRQCACGKVVKQ